jgi:hypothetical protein
MSDDSEDTKVGYGRPPKANRFRPGQSGNPKGRPKAAKNFRTAISEELNGIVPVSVNGRRRKITRFQVIAKQMVNRAVNGDTKVLPILLSETRHHEREAENAPPPPQASPEDQAVLDGLLDRLRLFDAARSTSPAAKQEQPTSTDPNTPTDPKEEDNDGSKT